MLHLRDALVDAAIDWVWYSQEPVDTMAACCEMISAFALSLRDVDRPGSGGSDE